MAKTHALKAKFIFHAVFNLFDLQTASVVYRWLLIWSANRSTFRDNLKKNILHRMAFKLFNRTRHVEHIFLLLKLIEKTRKTVCTAEKKNNRTKYRHLLRLNWLKPKAKHIILIITDHGSVGTSLSCARVHRQYPPIYPSFFPALCTCNYSVEIIVICVGNPNPFCCFFGNAPTGFTLIVHRIYTLFRPFFWYWSD